MEACLGNNGPDQGQTLAAADRWRTDGTERELAMLIEVRGGRSWRFLALRANQTPHPAPGG
jgi:hypothetical protein